MTTAYRYQTGDQVRFHFASGKLGDVIGYDSTGRVIVKCIDGSTGLYPSPHLALLGQVYPEWGTPEYASDGPHAMALLATHGVDADRARSVVINLAHRQDNTSEWIDNGKGLGVGVWVTHLSRCEFKVVEVGYKKS